MGSLDDVKTVGPGMYPPKLAYCTEVLEQRSVVVFMLWASKGTESVAEHSRGASAVTTLGGKHQGLRAHLAVV
jgi:hypothetical protein